MTSSSHQVAAVIALLAERWPACFSVYQGDRKPLKVGIHLEIIAALDGAVTPAKLSRALRRYTSNRSYRARLIAGAQRVGLEGEPSGTVTAEQAALPPRLSLADLRAAARARREGAS
jgi:ProP effector